MKKTNLLTFLIVVTLILSVINTYAIFKIDGKLEGTTADKTGGAVADDKPVEQGEDWSFFENELPQDMKSKIASFSAGTPEVYEGRISEFKAYEEIPKTLIVFYYEGCGWCTKYHPVLVEAKEKYPDVTIYALDLGTNRDIASKYGVTGTPSNIINGKYIVGGYMPIEDLSAVFDKLN